MSPYEKTYGRADGQTGGKTCNAAYSDGRVIKYLKTPFNLLVLH